MGLGRMAVVRAGAEEGRMEIVSSLNTLDTNCSYQESGDFLEQMPLKLLCLLIKFQIWNTFLFDDFV